MSFKANTTEKHEMRTKYGIFTTYEIYIYILYKEKQSVRQKQTQVEPQRDKEAIYRFDQ